VSYASRYVQSDCRAPASRRCLGETAVRTRPMASRPGVQLRPTLSRGNETPLLVAENARENLAPLRRFLASRVGRRWDDVYSEVRAAIRADSAAQLHVLQHLNGRWRLKDTHGIDGVYAATKRQAGKREVREIRRHLTKTHQDLMSPLGRVSCQAQRWAACRNQLAHSAQLCSEVGVGSFANPST
jgi:hypothetical protein